MRNIVLVGFMGTGKTAVAKTVAEDMNLEYVSTDELIEKKEGMPITRIFSEKGEAYFRGAEKDVIGKASALEGAVIDAGGGAVIDPENVKALKRNGIVICLWAEPEVILERIRACKARPLLNVADPLGTIAELLEKRKSFYERADHHIRTSKMSVSEVAAEVEKIIKNA